MAKTENKKWTMVKVSDRFDEAIYTLKRLPKVGVPGWFNSWPGILHSASEIAQSDKKLMRLPPPSAEAISRMEECLSWILWLDDDVERKLVWLRARRVYWKVACAKVGYGRTRATEIHTIALLKITTRLNARQMRDLHVRTKK